jgi:hypothetical protein
METGTDSYRLRPHAPEAARHGPITVRARQGHRHRREQVGVGAAPGCTAADSSIACVRRTAAGACCGGPPGPLLPLLRPARRGRRSAAGWWTCRPRQDRGTGSPARAPSQATHAPSRRHGRCRPAVGWDRHHRQRPREDHHPAPILGDSPFGPSRTLPTSHARICGSREVRLLPANPPDQRPEGLLVSMTATRCPGRVPGAPRQPGGCAAGRSRVEHVLVP